MLGPAAVPAAFRVRTLLDTDFMASEFSHGTAMSEMELLSSDVVCGLGCRCLIMGYIVTASRLGNAALFCLSTGKKEGERPRLADWCKARRSQSFA
jgi:hypothetical protein